MAGSTKEAGRMASRKGEWEQNKRDNYLENARVQSGSKQQEARYLKNHIFQCPVRKLE